MKSKIAFLDRKMAITAETGIVFRLYDDLMYILFDKPYCILHFTGNNKYMVGIRLQYVMDRLPKGSFIKCKRSAILNVHHCKEFRKNPPTAVMDDDKEIKLSQQNVLDFNWMIDCLSSTSPSCQVCTDDEIDKQVP